MKITKTRLREIIKEEIQKLNEIKWQRKKIMSYKGSDIIDLGHGVIAVGDMKGDPRSDYLVDLDDSKIGGNRKSVGMDRDEQIKAAKEYIDWRIKANKK